jgi:hypothetical protein
MSDPRPAKLSRTRKKTLQEAIGVLKALGFGPKQCNEVAGYTLLALLNLRPGQSWTSTSAPLIGITPIISFVAETYKVTYAPNTRETIRDEAVKYFVQYGLLTRNPDDPTRPTNSGNTVYQIEVNALRLFRSFGTQEWEINLQEYLSKRDDIRKEIQRVRNLARVPVILPSGNQITLSPGGQNPLIKSITEEFCACFLPGGTVLYIGDAEDKFLYLESDYLRKLNIVIPPPAKMPDVIIHDPKRNWLVLIEAVTSAGPVDGKRRMELKQLFSGCTAGLVFVTAFQTREAMRNFLPQISWETEVWVAENPEHLIHFDGERFLGPYPDVAARR